MKEPSKVLKLKLAHESCERRSKKMASNYIIEFFEIHRRTRKKNLFREMREQRLLIEAKKSCQPTLTELFEIHRRTRKTRFVHEAKPLV